MEENMLVIGMKENNMEEVFLLLEHKENKVNGNMEIEKDGLYLIQIQI